MRNQIDLTILLDCSGSMANICSDMEGSLKTVLEDQKQFNDVVVSYYRFHSAGHFEEVFTGKPIKDVGEIKLNPNGSTALIDAWCLAIDKTGQRLGAMNEADRPEKVMFCVITDGEENDSKEYTEAQLKERIKTQEEQYNWKFLYLGANQVAQDTAMHYGAHRARTMTYDASAPGVARASMAFACSISDFRCNNWVPGDVTQDQP